MLFLISVVRVRYLFKTRQQRKPTENTEPGAQRSECLILNRAEVAVTGNEMFDYERISS